MMDKKYRIRLQVESWTSMPHNPDKWWFCKVETFHGNKRETRIDGFKTIDEAVNAIESFKAAPDLLEACQAVVDYHRKYDSGNGELFGLDFVTTCINAIRKATD